MVLPSRSVCCRSGAVGLCEEQVVKRGSVWWVDLGVPQGSEPGFVRPAIVVSADAFNRSRINKIIVVAITSNLRLGAAAGNVPLAKGTAGLAKSCVVNVSQIATVDRSHLVEELGSLHVALMGAVDAGLRLALSF